LEEVLLLTFSFGLVVPLGICEHLLGKHTLVHEGRKLIWLKSDQWAVEVGDQRWSWEGLLPYFKNSETFFPCADLKDVDLSNVHGFSGPIKVRSTYVHDFFFYSSAVQELLSHLKKALMPSEGCFDLFLWPATLLSIEGGDCDHV
jgi:choline dehydrogenase-like flavoprotein